MVILISSIMGCGPGPLTGKLSAGSLVNIDLK